MEQDKHETRVMFYFEPKEKESTSFYSEVFAVFPEEYHNLKMYGRNMVTCYAHIGQHSGCHVDYLTDCKKCTNPIDYEYLKLELEELGYNLRILNEV